MKNLYTKNVLIIIALLFQISLYGQEHTFDWAKSMGGSSSDYSFSITTDNQGYIYSTGYFQNTVTFGNTALTSNGDRDIFIQKLDTAGNLLWVKQIGGIQDDRGYNLAIDNLGKLYITGIFKGTVDFDPSSSVSNLTSNGDFDIYLLKLDNNGNFIWAKSIGGNLYDNVQDIALDNIGNVVLTGGFRGTVDFDPNLGISNFTALGSSDIFVLKLDASGNFIWNKSMGGTSSESGKSISVDSNNNIFLTGSFSGTTDFDPSASVYNLTSSGYYDAFILKLNNNGNFIWGTSFGGSDWDSGYEILIDNYNNLYVTGYFKGTADFDPSSNVYNLSSVSFGGSVGAEDIFILKLDNNKNFLWAKSMGDYQIDEGKSIALDNAGNIYTTGSFSKTVDFDPSSGVYSLTSFGAATSNLSDVFIQKLNPNGDFIWVKQIGGTSGDVAYDIAIDIFGNIITTGIFENTANFDPSNNTFNLTSNGNEDIFIQKLSLPTDDIGATNITASCGSPIQTTITNFGGNDIDTVTVQWSVNNVLQGTLLNTTTILGGGTQNITLGSYSFNIGQSYTIKTWTSQPNNNSDTDVSNDTITTIFTGGLSGIYTIGGTNPDYSTLTLAVSDLHTYGVCGPTIFNIRDGVYNEKITINQITGVDNTNTITFQSESGDSSQVLVYSYLFSSQDNVIEFDGADWITLRGITIEPNLTSGWSRLVGLINGADHITIENCVLRGRDIANPNTFYASIYSSSTVDNYTTIRNNNFIDNAYGIYLWGNFSGGAENGLIIENNHFSNHYHSGINISYQDDLTITNNHILIQSVYGLSYGIRCSNAGEGTIVASNTVLGAIGYGVQILGSSSSNLIDTSYIINNYIQVEDGGNGYGLYSGINNVKIANNTVRVNSLSTNSYAFYNNSLYAYQVNNIFYNQTGYAARLNFLSLLNQSDNNNYYTGGTNLITYVGATDYTLSGWQAFSNFDANSKNVNPFFLLNNSYHINSFLLDDAGTPLNYVTVDIEGKPRSIIPDIGANEFTSATFVFPQTNTICVGDTFIIGNNAYTEPGNYVTDAFGPPNSDTTLILTLLQGGSNVTTTLNQTICDNQSVSVGSQSFNTTGTHIVNLQTWQGCDSVVTLNLIVNPTQTTTLTQTICDNQSVTVGTQTFNTIGTHIVNLQTWQGCDSVVTLNLIVNPTQITTLNQTICDNQSVTVGTQNFNTTGTHIVTLQTWRGCDSIVTLNLIVNPTATTTLTQTICDNQTYTVGSQSFNTTGTHVVTLQTWQGCDSVVTLNLIVNPTQTTTLNQTICSNQTYTVGSQSFNSTGTYIVTLQTSESCDSVVTLNLTVNPTAATTLTQTICGNQNYTVGTQSFNTTGTHVVTLQTWQGCDSTVTLNLIVNPTATTTLNQTICDNQSVTVGTQTFNTTGTHVVTLQTWQGCDSVVTLNLIVNPTATTTLTQTICSNQNYTVGSQSFNSAGTFIVTLQTWQGCDSVVTLNLTVLPIAQTSLTQTICANQSVTIGTQTFNTTGIYPVTFTAANGCDSIVTLDLTVLPTPTTVLNEIICDNQTYTVGSQTFNTSGTYGVVLIAANGCDSTVTLNLTVNPTQITNLSPTICQGETFTVGTTDLTQTGIDTILLTSYEGCDSSVIVNLTVLNHSSSTIAESICQGESYEGYTTTGTFIDNLVAANGCDSIRTINLTVNTLPTPTITQLDAITLESSAAVDYQWFLDGTAITGANNQTLTISQTGIYEVEATDANNCSGMSDTMYVIMVGTDRNIIETYKVVIAPNPNKGQFELSVTDLPIGEWTIEVYNITGQLMYQQLKNINTPNDNTAIQLETADGMYILRMTNSNGITINRKFIITK